MWFKLVNLAIQDIKHVNCKVRRQRRWNVLHDLRLIIFNCHSKSPFFGIWNSISIKNVLLWHHLNSQYRHFPTMASISATETALKSGFETYQRKIVNNLGYFAMARTRVGIRLKTTELKNTGKQAKEEFYLESTSVVAQLIYWFFYTNTSIKAIFLAFLITGYFGPVEFLDKIAALDYILCVGIVTFGSCIWFKRYPLYGMTLIQILLII